MNTQTHALLRASQAARALGIAAQSLFRMGDRGRIAFETDPISGWRLYAADEVERVRQERAARQTVR